MGMRLDARAAHRWLLLILAWVLPEAAPGAELKPETVAAYEQYIARLEQDFSREASEADQSGAVPRGRLHTGEIVTRPGHEDGIISVPGGLIHHWRGTAFLPDVTLRRVLAVVQDYGSYAGVYDWVIRARLVGRADGQTAGHERFWAYLRIERSASVVTSTLDIWTAVEYRYPREGIAAAVSNAECIRQVEDAGRPAERRLPAGQGSGYLWRANTYTVYREGDGGVYVDLQTVGLSRRFPRLLGWLVEPIARRLGRGSAADSLARVREAVAGRIARPVPDPPEAAPTGTGWCGDPANPGPPVRREAEPVRYVR